MAPLASIEHNLEKLGKPLEQVNIFDAFIDRDTDAQSFKYSVSRHKKIAGPLAKDTFTVSTLKKFVTLNKNITPKDIPGGIRVLNSCFVNKIKNLNTYKNYKKSCLIKQVYNDKSKNLVLTRLLTIE